LATILAITPTLLAQQPAGAATSPLPDSPSAQQPAAPTGTAATFIGYATNKSILFPDIATSSGPMTDGQKFKLFVNQSISPPYILIAAMSAAFNQAINVPEGYGQGWDAYASRFGANMARASSNSFFGTFVFASILHQDPRFFPQGHPSFWGSVKYSAERVVLTRNDAGSDEFDTSGILAPVAAEALANVYLPDSERTVGKTAKRFGIDLAWQFGGNMFKNYWPTLFRTMGLNRLKVIPTPETPVEHPPVSH
jgi:hypothetical protein